MRILKIVLPLWGLSVFLWLGCDNTPASNNNKNNNTATENKGSSTTTENKGSSTTTENKGSSTTTEENKGSSTTTEENKGEQKGDPTSNGSVTKTEEDTKETSSSTEKTPVTIDMTTRGTLTGKVSFLGEPPTLAPFPITKDKSTCCAGSSTEDKPNHRLQLSADKGVKHAVVIIEGVKETKPWPKLNRLLDQKNCAYEPFIQWMDAGKKIKIRNSDPVLHNVHGYCNGRTAFNLAMPLPDQEIKQALKEPGIYEVFCDAGHAWMSSYIYVSEHPYVAITSEDGTFSIDGVPPGEYEVKLWHAGWAVDSTVTDNSGMVTGYKFAPPVTQIQKIRIEAGKETPLIFELK